MNLGGAMKNVEIPKWLERLPLAPEFYPTDTEFADPIAYISKIEKEASAFGICKVIPPLPKPSRKYVLHNLNKSLSKCPELDFDVNLVTQLKADSGVRNICDRTVNGGESRAVFTTRHQELGCEKGKKAKGAAVGVQKQVWQSGEVYTLEQFEAKAKSFAKSQLGVVKDVNPLVIETMFWKAALEKPIYVEYANDVPGSGFSEPEGLMRYFERRRRRRRKRNSFDRNNLDTVNNSTDSKESGSQIRPDSCTETASNFLPSHQSNHEASFSGPKDFQDSSEMEGTAGWKLSNSPWNLQVIARSSGSLTRFMPDDIPGVTSPMVYIGMLFSWFAWHVEDHELHSLNFLHMGSPKTWYAVPGDYAFNFEEAIRRANGVNADRLVALSHLGEKTTLLSPEIIAASGIPCCRLVQNPGEFVVTFPRAYHIGFSHGFNCGEAANFGTPMWLTIAKEAAVRRAAMNYLPMLSHQQLLYLLTMSFISRIPRSLLPGVRSSRSRDRQKEERELSVKRAFIEDILQENSRLTVLRQRSSSYHTVLWDVDSLPSSSKESELCKDSDASVLTSVGEDSPKNDDNVHDVDQLSKYISAVGFDLDDDDLAYDFQVESGSLPCVACGILGYPFMTVVQPSEAASIHLTEASLGAEKSQSTHSSTEQSLNHDSVSSKIKAVKEWNISNAYLKPRIFCLEHAIEMEELLSSRGGANVLVICHSDFQKIETHAVAIAEEIAIPFCYTDVPIGNASREDLNLIEIAIAREEQVARSEDWTSLLNISLQHCVKVKKSSPSSNIQHLLSLGGLFSNATPDSNTSSINWISRKLRSKRHSKRLLQSKPSDAAEILNDDTNEKKEHQMDKNVKLIQYSRKRFKARTTAGIQGPMDINNLVVQDTDCEDPDKEDTDVSVHIRVENNGNDLPFDGNCEFQHEIVASSFESHSVNLVTASTVIEDFEAQTRNCQTSDDVGGSRHDFEAHEVKVVDSETVDSTLDKNRIDSAAESETFMEEESVNEVIKSCDLLAENDSLPKEASRYGGSNCWDNDDEQIEEHHLDETNNVAIRSDDSGKLVLSQENEVLNDSNSMEQSKSTPKAGNKRKREDQFLAGGFIRGPCEGLRPRAKEVSSVDITEQTVKKSRKATDKLVPHKDKKANQKGLYKCELDGCTMTFRKKAELQLHEGNRCPVDGCRKKFNSHKYAIQHQRVHDDDRPLKCSWEGCTMSFKWAWARTEHLRVHTGERPYTCKVKGCGLTFRFVSDFSRHRRKTGHYVT